MKPAIVAALAGSASAVAGPTVAGTVFDSGASGSEYVWENLSGPTAPDTKVATNAKVFNLGTYGGSVPSGTKLSELYPSVTDQNGKDVSALLGASYSKTGSTKTINGNSAYGVQVDAFNFPEGSYTFSRKTSAIASGEDASFDVASTTIVIDRTAPSAKDATSDQKVYVGAADVVVPIPVADMFKDNMSTAATVLSVKAIGGDAMGFSLDGSDLKATSVIGVGGKLAFEVTARDDAGNKATAVFTIPINAKPMPSLSVYDARGNGVASTSTLFSGSAASKTGSKFVLTAVANFPDAVADIDVADLVITGATADDVKVEKSSGGRTWTWTVTFNTVPGADLTFKVADEAGKRADDVLTSASNEVAVTIDAVAPVAKIVGGLPSAVAGAPYFAYLPLAAPLFVDDVTADAQVDVISASTTTPVGLALTAKKQGMAFISGTPSGQPSATCEGKTGSTFTIKAKDAAGNVQDAGSICLPVAAAATGSNGLKMSKGAVSFTEGAASNPSVDASAIYTGLAAKTVVVYLESPDAEDAGDEKIDASAYTAAGTETVSAYAQNAAKVGMLSLTTTDVAGIPAASVQAFVRALKYANAKEFATSGARTVRVVVQQLDDSIVAVGSRAVAVTTKNSAPAFSKVNPDVTYAEGTSAITVVDPDLDVTDKDDDYSTAATVSIAAKAGDDFGACDTARDRLSLNAADSATVFSTWDASTCTLTLKPQAGWAAKTSDFVAALKQVKYWNEDMKNPSNYGTATKDTTRSLGMTITDAASAGIGASKAPKEGKVSSATTTKATAWKLSIALTDDAPKIDLAKAYSEGGFLYSTDPASRVSIFEDTSVSPTQGYKVRKFLFRTDGTTTTATTFDLVLDLGKQADAVFGKGSAIVDPDNKDELSADGKTVSTATATLLGSHTGLTVGTVAFADGKLTIPLIVADQTAFKGTYGLQVAVTDGTSPVTLSLDFLSPKCVSEITDSNRATSYPSNDACYNADGTSKIASTNVDPATGATLTGGAYDDQKAALDEMLNAHLESGSDAATRINGMRAQRQLARGTYKMEVPAGSFSAVNNVDMNALPPTSDIVNRLPAPRITNKLDDAVALQLSPAGLQFTEPVTVCMHVGDAPAGFKYEMAISSEIDPKDTTKGFADWEAMAEQTYNAASGELCGQTKHFSVVGPMLVPVPMTQTQQKVFAMGASCPNDCSGKGYCRETGKCMCFSGFEGYDCSLRACPAAESWDSADGVVHKPSECSARGACNRKTGICACYDGFEGSSCERVSCPNDCSGHGNCRLLSELPKAKQAGYSSWETTRVQVCQCDGGYTGNDCSQRVCPFGDDPETVCVNSKRQIQTITLDFGTLPSTLAGSVPGSVYDADIALTFTTAGGSSFTTPRIENVFDSSNGPDHLKTALKSLPAFAVSDVAVSATGSSSSPVVQYQVTFDGDSLEYFMTPNMAATNIAGTTVSGNQALLTCPTIAGTKYVAGCSGQACRPQFKQLRILDVVGGPDVAVNEGVTLAQPEPLTAGDESVAGKWGAIVTLTVQTTNGVQTYKATSSVYEAGAGESVAETVMPPSKLRNNLPLVYGLHVDLAETVADGTYVIRWRLPTCTVEQTQSADPDFESLECSRRGVCDRKVGECVCFSGYAGSSCSQQTVVV